MNDFKSAQAIRATSLRTALRNKQFGQLQHMSQGLGLNYFTGLTPNVDLSSTLTGSFPDYAVKNNTQTGKGSLLVELDASIRAKLFTSQYLVTPYLQAGLGGSYYKGYWGAFVPAGVGLQAEILPETFVLANAQYRMGIGDKGSHHFFYSIGLAGTIGKKKAHAKVVPLPPLYMPPLDSDGDGILDSLDGCPLQKGLAIYKGCPDFDGDSIPDNEDRCPFEKGLKRYHGCPIPDSDGDGVNDESDKCPQQRGLPAYEGCPPPDRDRDGVPDSTDKCPDVPGPVSNEGCPVIPDDVRKKVEQAAQQIFFATGSAVLLPKSYKALDEVVTLLKADSLQKMDIEGHTDNTGTPAGNQLLSERRAKAVYDYFRKQGIAGERLKFSGLGQLKPVADNTTSAGRAANRRVVLNLHYE